VATPIPKNEATFSLAEIVVATRGSLAREGGERLVRGVCTDTRAVGPGELFVALRGERFDGHDHVTAAASAGATAVLASRDVEVPTAVSVIRVDDTLRALGDLSACHRLRWSHAGLGPARRLVAVTGSAGKTTTRHALGKALAELGLKVHTSAGNLNNAVGVPMTLFGLEARHRVAVVEIGMSVPGEIKRSAEISRPDAGVVTLVADAHTEGVGSIWGVLEEKSDLLRSLGERGVAAANGDSDLTRAALVKAGPRRRLLYGEASDCDVRLVSRASRGLAGSELTVDVRRHGQPALRVESAVPLLGKAGAYAALATLAVLVGLDEDRALDGGALSRAVAATGGNEAGRLAPVERADGAIVIDDAYNANPASMTASVEASRELADALGKDLVLVLGSMFELGGRSEALHREVGEAAARARPRVVIAAGDRGRAIGASAEAHGVRVVYAEGAAEAERAAVAEVGPRDLVLVKASNSLGLARVAAHLTKGAVAS
jgi:UDP-N-acetylmuramoyl-tripeptide--D-alanyl-D-alanine ligase